MMLFFGEPCLEYIFSSNLFFQTSLASYRFLLRKMEGKHTAVAPSELNQNYFKHKYLREKNLQTPISDNYCLWYSPFHQQDALNDFSILQKIDKRPIIAVKEKSDKSDAGGQKKTVRLPFVCRADRIARICLQSEPIQINRHFYEVARAKFQKSSIFR